MFHFCWQGLNQSTWIFIKKVPQCNALSLFPSVSQRFRPPYYHPPHHTLWCDGEEGLLCLDSSSPVFLVTVDEFLKIVSQMPQENEMELPL